MSPCGAQQEEEQAVGARYRYLTFGAQASVRKRRACSIGDSEAGSGAAPHE